MNTPIFDSLVNAVPEVCGSIGPRIGEEGSPRCAETLGHDGLHHGFEGSGFEREFWGDPLSRDAQFAKDWQEWLANKRRFMLGFLYHND